MIVFVYDNCPMLMLVDIRVIATVRLGCADSHDRHLYTPVVKSLLYMSRLSKQRKCLRNWKRINEQGDCLYHMILLSLLQAVVIRKGFFFWKDV